MVVYSNLAVDSENAKRIATRQRDAVRKHLVEMRKWSDSKSVSNVDVQAFAGDWCIVRGVVPESWVFATVRSRVVASCD